MNEEGTQANELYNQGLATIVQTVMNDKLDEAQKKQEFQRAIELFDQALALGIQGENEIRCHKELGELLFEHTPESEGMDGIVKEGVDALPNLHRTLTELERALLQDSQTGGLVFKDRLEQSLFLPKLDFIWSWQAVHLKKTHGPRSAVSYLEGKIRMLDYLGEVNLPGTSFHLGRYNIESDNRDVGVEWLRRTLTAEDYGDVLDHRETKMYKTTEIWKAEARRVLPGYTSPKSSPSEMNTQKQGGCFIATSAYGSPLAPEVEAFRRFRDEVLLSSRVGKAFVLSYYFISPPLAALISRYRFLRTIARLILLDPLSRLLKK